jgi:hypothetical protein
VTGALKLPGAAETPSLVVGVAPVCQLPPPAPPPAPAPAPPPPPPPLPPPMLWAIVVPASIEVASKTAANIFDMFFSPSFRLARRHFAKAEYPTQPVAEAKIAHRSGILKLLMS